jgi:1,4-alpha-glucan branching enzyme
MTTDPDWAARPMTATEMIDRAIAFVNAAPPLEDISFMLTTVRMWIRPIDGTLVDAVPHLVPYEGGLWDVKTGEEDVSRESIVQALEALRTMEALRPLL